MFSSSIVDFVPACNFFCWRSRTLTPSFVRQDNLGEGEYSKKLYNPENRPGKPKIADFYWLMIRKAAQRAWHRGWTANLSDTSNTKVTFPNSWKYHVSFWWLTAFSSLATDLSPSSHEVTFLSWPSGNYHIVHDGRKGPAAQLPQPSASPTVPQLRGTDTHNGLVVSCDSFGGMRMLEPLSHRPLRRVLWL